jgi:glycosyltransferase involved in cell wall biosynthesis
MNSINSVLTQESQVDQILIVSDSSTDDTDHIVKNLNNSKIEYIKLLKNVGQVTAINKSINKANGDIIYFLDSGDTWVSDYIKEANKIYKKNANINLVYGQIINSEYTSKIFEPQNYKDVLFQGYLGITSAISIRSELIKFIFPIPDTYFRNRNFDDFVSFKAAKIGGFVSLRRAILYYDWGNVNSSDNFIWVVRSNFYLLEYFANDFISLLGYRFFFKKFLCLFTKNYKANFFIVIQCIAAVIRRYKW